MASTHVSNNEYTLIIASEEHWTSISGQIEERQDVKQLSTVKPSAVAPLGHSGSREHLQLCVEDVVLQRLKALTEEAQISMLLSVWHLVLNTYTYSLQTVVGFLEPNQNSNFTLMPSLLKHDYAFSQQFAGILDVVQCELKRYRNSSTSLRISTELNEKLKSLLDNVFVHVKGNVSKLDYNWTGKLDVPLALICSSNLEDLVLRLEYKSEDFYQRDIAQLLETYVRILNQVSANTQLHLNAITFVSTEERRSVLSTGVTMEIPLNKTMVTLFEEQAARVPNNLAVIFEGKELKYAELDSKANQLAHLILKTVEVKEETILALCLGQSELIEICILAVWKVGAAYVAIDPAYPADRKKYILDDTNAQLILTDQDNAATIENICVNGFVVNVQAVDMHSLPTSKPVGFRTNGDSLSHVVYTSGTTGKPKGVLTRHRGLVNHCFDYRKRYDLGEDEVILLFFNYVFNAFSEPLTLALANGFPLLLVRKSLLMENDKFHDYMRVNGITHIDATPSLLGMMDLQRIKTLRRVVPGGEILTPEVFAKIRNDVPAVKIYNVYGNSEGTLCTMTSLLETYENSFQRPVANKQCLVLGSNLGLLPMNAVGELCFSGIGVARGYLNNENLTHARFVSNPYNEELSHNSQLFRTGDLGRRLPNGCIEYIGRKDLQIKIRGFRVELGEIENAIRDYPGITQSAVIASGGVKSEEIVLTGFYVMGGNSDPDAIRGHIRRFLPDYMVPAKLIRLAEMPLTPNGKTDRNALAAVTVNVNNNMVVEDQVEIGDEDEFTQQIRHIWEEVLGAPKNSVDIEADFFDLGGNSLMAMTLGERLSKELSVNIDAAFLYNNSTVLEFADSLRNIFQ